MHTRVFVAAALAGMIGLSAPQVAFAQTPADLTKFNESCIGGEAFLLGQVPEGVDSASILTPLCGCLTTAFKDLPQKDVDILAADLRGEGTDELHTAHGSYDKVTELAREGHEPDTELAMELHIQCFARPEVSAAVQAASPAPAEPAPAEPATPATPQ